MFSRRYAAITPTTPAPLDNLASTVRFVHDRTLPGCEARQIRGSLPRFDWSRFQTALIVCTDFQNMSRRSSEARRSNSRRTSMARDFMVADANPQRSFCRFPGRTGFDFQRNWFRRDRGDVGPPALRSKLNQLGPKPFTSAALARSARNGRATAENRHRRGAGARTTLAFGHAQQRSREGMGEGLAYPTKSYNRIAHHASPIRVDIYPQPSTALGYASTFAQKNGQPRPRRVEAATTFTLARAELTVGCG